MTEWKPDTEFLDFILVNHAAGDSTSEQMVEHMRAGETPIYQHIYLLVHDRFKIEYEEYKANNKGIKK